MQHYPDLSLLAALPRHQLSAKRYPALKTKAGLPSPGELGRCSSQQGSSTRQLVAPPQALCLAQLVNNPKNPLQKTQYAKADNLSLSSRNLPGSLVSKKEIGEADGKPQ